MRTKNSILKKLLVVIILIVMSTNFIMPKYVYAASIGEQLVSGIFYLVAYIGDAFLSIIQYFMIGTSDLYSFGEYAIKYSPGIIFANQVPALDINFITADEDDNFQYEKVTEDISSWESMKSVIQNAGMTADDFTQVYTTGELENYPGNEKMQEYAENLAKYGVTFSYYPQTGGGNGYFINVNNTNGQHHQTISGWGNWGKMKDIENILVADPGGGTIFGAFDSNIKEIHLYIAQTDLSLDEDSTETGVSINLFKIEWTEGGWGNQGVITVYRSNESVTELVKKANESLTDEEKLVTLKSTALALKDNIARWYIALRTFALVGLLSVLLYLGIRIILSSASAQNKAKYKNMLIDWLVAICILFLLHYVMAFLTTFTERINEMFASNVISITKEDGIPTDELMNKVRNEIGADLNNAWNTAGFTLMYFVLVILTISFTFQYLKRVVYLAFLTMIAPLIALTYPIDKVRDGKAQAFSFWLKEYIVNCLIQPVHLLLYTLLITNAFDFAKENILYAIVALTFMMPAEKIVKQMFGINSQQSSFNTLGAAAGGAMVMNMLNKVKGMGGKGGSSGKGGNSGADNSNSYVRTATRNGTASSGGGTTGGAVVGATGGGTGSGGSGSSGSGGAGSSGGGSGRSGSSGSGAGTASYAGRTKRNISGVNALKSIARLSGKGFVKGMKATPGAIGKGTAKAFGMAAATTAMLAADIADGNIDHLGADLFAGISAGNAIGNTISGIPGKGADLVGRASEAIQKNMMGEEAYQNMKFDQEFYKSSGYKKIASSSQLKSQYSSEQIRAQTQMFLDNGITDASKIQEALEAGVNGDEYKTLDKLGVTDVKKFSSLKTSKNLSGQEVAARMAIAKNMPAELYDNENAFVRFAGRYGLSASQARSLFNDINDFV